MIETTPFLTEIDSCAEVKGSCDPLGLVDGTAKSLNSCVRALGFINRIFPFDPARRFRLRPSTASPATRSPT